MKTFRGALALLAFLALPVACAAAAPHTFVVGDTSVVRVIAPGRMLPGTNVPEDELPLRMRLGMPPPSARTQRPVPPLDVAHMARLRRAADLRTGGLPAQSLDSLLALDREVPHHPWIVRELVTTQALMGDDRGVVERLRRERPVTRDSLLGSAELEGALERLGRPREAAEAALETWIVSAFDAAWARATIVHLAPLDPRGVTDAMRAACAARPGRADLALGLAWLLGRQGQAAEAVHVLEHAEPAVGRGALRRAFVDDVLAGGTPTDSAAAFEALVSVAADTACIPNARFDGARRALALASARGRPGEGAERVTHALAGVPAERWNPDLLLLTARALREGGHPAEAASLLALVPGLAGRSPELALERALALAREGPPERAVAPLDTLARVWAPARFALAEAQFWAGDMDSALVNYQRASDDTESPDAMNALDRSYLIEDAAGAPELRVLGAIAWQRWRGDGVRVRALADSLWHVLPTSSHCYATAALEAYAARAAAGAWRDALVPLAAIADSLPGDRLAPVARQRAGEAWLQLGDSHRALGEFEECLARYPRAWNSPEVRRQVEKLHKERRS